jgi:CRISPR-associated endonuclease/helicase Cas3
LAQNHRRDVLKVPRTVRRRPTAVERLVLHLIASHHGWARPIFLPVIEERIEHALSVRHHCGGVHPELIFTAISGRHLYELTSGVCHRFHELQRRYGHYHLALIETLLRLADWRASETPDEI